MHQNWIYFVLISCVTVKAVDSPRGAFLQSVLQIIFWTNVYIFIFSCEQIVSLNHILCNLSFSDFKSTSEIDHIPWPSTTGACGNWIVWFIIFPLLWDFGFKDRDIHFIFTKVECAKPVEKRNSRRVSFAPANDVLLFSKWDTRRKKRFSCPQGHWHINVICIFSLQRCEKCLSCPKSFTGFNTVR